MSNQLLLNNLAAITMRPDQIKQLRQAMFNLPVSGRLVPQDPNEEAVRLPKTRTFSAASGMDDEVLKQALSGRSNGFRFRMDSPFSSIG